MRDRGDALGDRMKAYERRETDHRFTAFAPVVARMDGRAFSTWTRTLDRPYDATLGDVMIEVTRRLVHATGARIGYTQSDEITLVLLVDRIGETLPFGGRGQKLCSILASMTTAMFITECLERRGARIAELAMQAPHFDARAFQVPTRFEAANALLWRERDAVRNAISLAARQTHPQTRLQGMRSADVLAMMADDPSAYQDLPVAFRRGAFLQHRTPAGRPEAGAPRARLAKTDADRMVARRTVARVDMPPFASVTNREDVIFERAEPMTSASTADD